MRRLAIVAAALTAACSSKENAPGLPPDITPPAAPFVRAPAAGARLVASDLVRGQLVFSGTAEPSTTVEVEVTVAGGAQGFSAGSAVAGSDGAWSLAAGLASAMYTVRARATDAAGNASAWSEAATFTLDRAPLAVPLPAGWPYVVVTSWGQTVAVTPRDASGLGELFRGQANSWTLDPDFSLGAGHGREYASALVLHTGAPTSPTSHTSLLADFEADALAAFPRDQAASDAVLLTPTLGRDDVKGVAIWNALSTGIPAISGSYSAYLNGTAHSVLGGYLLEFTPGETYTFGWTHQAVLRAGGLVGADAPPYAPSYQVVLRTPAIPTTLIGEPLYASSTDVARATESVTRSGLPQHAVLQFELRSEAPGYVEIDDLTLSGPAGSISLRNAGFENGFDGWVDLSGGDSHHVRSSPRDVGAAGSALRVTRAFYAPPGAAWGRMVDVFENTAATPVATTAVYATLLHGTSPLAAVTQGGRAVVAWDRDATMRDLGIVFGTGTSYVADGDPRVYVLHDLSVPAGARVALVHFVVQLGETAGGASAANFPRGTDDECAAVLNGFSSLGVETYRRDLEPGIRDIVANL